MAGRFTNMTNTSEEFLLRATDHMEEELISALRAESAASWRRRGGSRRIEP